MCSELITPERPIAIGLNGVHAEERNEDKRVSGIDIRVAGNFANATTLAIISVDQTGVVRFVNKAATEIFGYEAADMIGHSVEMIIPERLRPAHASGFARAMAGEKLSLGGKSIEVYAVRKDSTEFPIELTLCAWQDETGMGAGAVIKDITERREREGRLLRLASRDILTGLLNRNGFTVAAREQFVNDSKVAVIMLDIDGFAEVNDIYGQRIGDSLLQAVAVRLPRILPKEARIGRSGGDEFAVLVPQITCPNEACAVAERLLKGFSEPFEVCGRVFELSASIGVALSPHHGADCDEVIASADFALASKRQNRGGFRLYDTAMKSEASRDRALREELLYALNRNEFVLHYQPQVHLSTGKVFGVEALIRWRHPERGLLFPGDFLPALEHSALALEIGWWTLEQACKDAATLNVRAQAQIKMGVNLFPAQLHSPMLSGKIEEALCVNGLRPDNLELEVTETIALDQGAKSLEAMTAMREIGVGIAFDDFGTGFASMSSLQRYPITTLKIDKGFIRDLMKRPRDAAITRALISMSRELGLETIAEGIETTEQESLLVELGCPAAQGYRYGRPMPMDDIWNLLGEDSHSSLKLNGTARAR